MKEQRIVIEIDADGGLSADAEGFSGDACLKDLEKLLADVAGFAAHIERKPEAGAPRVMAQKAQPVQGVGHGTGQGGRQKGKP